MAIISISPSTPNLAWKPWLDAQPGDIIRLAAGEYSVKVQRQPKAGPGVIVEPEPGAQVVWKTGVVVDQSTGWHFRSNPDGGPRMKGRGGQVGSNSDGCTFTNIDFYGDEAAGQDPAKLAVAGGIFGVGSKNVVMDGCTHRFVQAGIRYGPSAAGLTVRNALFDTLGSDGIGGIANDVLIEDVVMTNFFPGTALHQDALQVFHRYVNGGALPTGMVFRRIRLLKGAGTPVQVLIQCGRGTVVQDLWNQMGNYHGLTISDCEDVVVERVRADGMVGVVDATNGQQMYPWIKVDGANPTVRDCLAAGGVYGSTSVGTWERNGSLELAPLDDYSAGQAWWNRVVLGQDPDPPPPPPPPPPPQEPPPAPPAPPVPAARTARSPAKVRLARAPQKTRILRARPSRGN